MDSVLETSCESCGQVVGEDDRFCLSCGTRRRGPAVAAPPAVQNVRITGVDIPFGDLVTLLVWLALASIPAALILLAIGAVIALGLAGIGASLP